MTMNLAESLRHAVLALFAAWLLSTGVVSADEALERRAIVTGGIERSYYVHEPSRAPAGATRPAVLVLHGGGGNGKISALMSGFNGKADAEGFLAVYPNGSGRFGERLLTWNAGHCCAYAMRERTDDVRFISDLIDELVRRDRVDPKRVYVTGMSNGGMMSFRIGVELSHKVAAIAPVVAAMFGDERAPANPMPVLMFNSRTDESVPIDGGPPKIRGGTTVGDTDYKPAAYALDFWARANRCAAPPATAREPGVTITRYERCAGGAHVALYALDGGGHSWPGGKASGRRGADEPTAEVRATDLMWDFFKAHTR
jgi:polyhydroxybutyrate depolymerase